VELPYREELQESSSCGSGEGCRSRLNGRPAGRADRPVGSDTERVYTSSSPARRKRRSGPMRSRGPRSDSWDGCGTWAAQLDGGTRNSGKRGANEQELRDRRGEAADVALRVQNGDLVHDELSNAIGRTSRVECAPGVHSRCCKMLHRFAPPHHGGAVARARGNRDFSSIEWPALIRR